MNAPLMLRTPKPWLGAITLCFTAMLLSTSVLFCAEPKRHMGVPPDAVLYKNKWYRVYVENSGWKSSQAKCQRLGGSLAIVPDKETQDFLKKLANGRKLLLGATNEPKGVWTWVNGSAVTYTCWERGQPNNLKGREHYLAMGAKGDWLDVVDNSDWAEGYICEWPVRS
jgi:hypothetical protein